MTLKKALTFILLILSTIPLGAQTPSSFIHVDQFGYTTAAKKVAVLSDPQVGANSNLSYQPGQTLELKDASNDNIVWTGSPEEWRNGNVNNQSGDRGWWLDFTEWETPGNYYLLDPSNGEQSAIFEISDSVYHNLLIEAGRAFYYNRCNATKEAPYAEANWTDVDNFNHPLQDAECSFLLEPENADLRRDLSGGWFDAGDYNKYSTFAFGAVIPLLWAYVENPHAFGDNWNIPESGNEIPDLLDEVKWELDFLRKMVNPDGSAILKMGSLSGENISSPPSNNDDRRYYSTTCTSASISIAAMFAQAAEIFGAIPALATYADELSTEAIQTFSYWNNANLAGELEFDCDDGTIRAADADWDEEDQWNAALTAAIHLFALTESTTYQNFILANIDRAEPIAEQVWTPYTNELNTALLYYTTLEAADNELCERILNSFSADVFANTNQFFGMTNRGLYRAYIPNWSYHWGSNNIKARYATLNELIIDYEIFPADSADYREKSAGILHYFHGVNPFGMVYLSGMEGRGAEYGIQEVYHSWFNDGTDWDNSSTSLYGPAPGFLSGGPNREYSVPAIIPPSGQPMMKAYRDWNGGYPESSWEISEPAIYYQAAYLRCLAAQIPVPPMVEPPMDSTPVYAVEFDPEDVPNPFNDDFDNIAFYPNPSKDGLLQFQHLPLGTVLRVHDNEGRLLLSQEVDSTSFQVNLSAYPAAVYRLDVLKPGIGRVWSSQFVRQ
ncbi:MAG: glycoside hydrolase family 9 protein [Bacteroidota bacterium]